MDKKYNLEIIAIDSLECKEVEIYTSLSENELKHFYEPQLGLFIAESPVVIERALQAEYVPESVLTDELHLEEILAIFNKVEATHNIPVKIYVVSESVLRQIKGFDMTRGALCAFRRKKLLSVEEICEGAIAYTDVLDSLQEKKLYPDEKHMPKRIAVMEEVQNPTNVGAIFRSAAAMGIDAVILTSGSADPLYRRAVRVSMGNVFLIPWTIFAETKSKHNSTLVSVLKQYGYTTLAMALKDDTISIADPVLKQQDKIAIFLGTESEGLKDDTIASCDYTVKIPMAEGVDSLNVAAASAVAFWEIGKES